MKTFSGFVAVLAFAVTIVAQSPAPAASPSLNKPAIEEYIRYLLMWPAGVEITMSDPTPSPLPGLFAIKIRGTLDGRSNEEVFYVSADSKTIVRGDIYAVGKSPFQKDIDLLKTTNHPTLGAPDAPVSIVEFGDFQCPYCKEESGVVRNQLTAAFPNDVRLIYMDFPLEKIHAYAREAAVLGRCIFAQNNASFWAYHDWIFEHQGDLTPDNLQNEVLAYAGTDRNLDVATLNACAASPQPGADVDASVAIGKALGVDATPTFFINGRRMVGSVPLEDLKLVVEQELAFTKSQTNDLDPSQSPNNDTGCCSVQLSLPGTAK